MDTQLAIKFLYYLHERSEGISRQKTIELYDVNALKTDLEKLKSNLNDAPDLSSDLRTRIAQLEIHIREQYLEGSKKNWWGQILKYTAGHSAHGDMIRTLSTEAVAKDVLKFRNEVGKLLFLLETNLPL